MEKTNNIYDTTKFYEYEQTHDKPKILGFMDLHYHTDELIREGTQFEKKFEKQDNNRTYEGYIKCIYQDNKKTIIETKLYINGKYDMNGLEIINHYKSIQQINNKFHEREEHTNNILKKIKNQGYELVDSGIEYDEFGFHWDKENKKVAYFKFECLIPSDKTILEAHLKAEEDRQVFEKIGAKMRAMKYTKDGVLLKASYHYNIGDDL